LEESLQIFIQMCANDDRPFDGKHYRLGRALNAPQSLRRPHPPILIGGLGERKTLRLVAKYAQACNLVPGPELAHKLSVLRNHCDAVGRDYDEIEKTVIMSLYVGPEGQRVEELIKELRDLADLGISHVHGAVPNAPDLKSIDILGERVIPVAAEF